MINTDMCVVDAKSGDGVGLPPASRAQQVFRRTSAKGWTQYPSNSGEERQRQSCRCGAGFDGVQQKNDRIRTTENALETNQRRGGARY